MKATIALLLVTVLLTMLFIWPLSVALTEANRMRDEVANLRMTLAWEQRRIPLCQEDAVLMGIGDFEGGQWQAYQCGPAFDDYK